MYDILFISFLFKKCIKYNVKQLVTSVWKGAMKIKFIIIIIIIIISILFVFMSIRVKTCKNILKKVDPKCLIPKF